tara:strand:+ start:191 stop:673 length:483 start_codon:yes stop_codon:yes gene_type:complete
MSRTFRIRQRVKKFMMDGVDIPTNVIFDHINETLSWGVTMQQLGNILSKDKDIICTGTVRKRGSMTGTYTINTWSLTDKYKEDNKDISAETLVANIHKWLSEQEPGEYVAKDIRKGVGGVNLSTEIFRLVCAQAPEWLEIQNRYKKNRGCVTYVVLPRSS